ncbi:RE1 [Symbiodinium sp. CCMP2592]|nr:RE1 [Symbiodinium sp. CCMP2592]
MIKRAQVQEHKEVLHLPWVIEDEDVVHNFGEKDSPAEVDEDVIRCAKAAADNLYTYGIEEILSSLQDELRVVHTVHPREVDQNLPSWVPALKAEMKTLEDIGAIKRLVGQAAKDYLNLPGVQVVPGKAVYTVKPPNKPEAKYRRKARVVGCGNFQAKDDSEQNYSGGAASEAVRLGVAQAARQVWAICTGDVVSAFLRAPVPQGTLLALRPPAVLVRAGLAQPNEVWSVHMALYGFSSSPRWWGLHRTGIMKKATTPGGLTFHQGVADSEVWQVRDAGGSVVGLVIIYVDDFFIAAPKEICGDIYKWLAETWETTPIQFASSTTPIRFLGMEVREARNEAGDFEGYTLDQEGYLQEVLRHRNVRAEERSLLPATKEHLSLSSEHDPPTYSSEDLKLAQSITGELAWMAQRCRPDLAYVVSIMASLTTRDPARVAAIGRKTLAYLNHTSSWRLRFWTGGEPTLVTYTDSSYAPDGDRSHGGAVTFWGTCPIAWRSSRQQLVTTSSAETELVVAHHGCQQMESIDALLSDMGVIPNQRTIYVDNAAAITLATSEGGSWKTRHLKVRHRALRQRVEQGWVDVVYCPGDQQLADGLTKLLPSQRMNLLMEFWGLSAGGNSGDQVRLRQVQAPAEQVARLRATQESQRLSKKEMRELNGLLRENPGSLSPQEKERMIHLADIAGVDLAGILTRSNLEATSGTTARPSSVLGGSVSPPPPPDPFSASAADEELLRERRLQRRQPRAPPPPPPPTYENIVEEDARSRRAVTFEAYPVEPVSAEYRSYRARSVGTQVEMLKEMPKVVFVTPSGTCVHATRDCSTLNRSTKFLQKEVCAKCIPGQKEGSDSGGGLRVGGGKAGDTGVVADGGGGGGGGGAGGNHHGLPVPTSYQSLMVAELRLQNDPGSKDGVSVRNGRREKASLIWEQATAMNRGASEDSADALQARLLLQGAPRLLRRDSAVNRDLALCCQDCAEFFCSDLRAIFPMHDLLGEGEKKEEVCNAADLCKEGFELLSSGQGAFEQLRHAIVNEGFPSRSVSMSFDQVALVLILVWASKWRSRADPRCRCTAFIGTNARIAGGRLRPASPRHCPGPRVKEVTREGELRVLLVSQFPVFVAVGALIPVLPLRPGQVVLDFARLLCCGPRYGQEFGLSQSSVGLLVSSPSLAKLVLNLPFGKLADTLGRRSLMVGGMILCAAADVGTGLASSLPFLVVARLLLGAGLSSSDAGASAWVADATESQPESRASFLGVQNALTALAFVLGPAVGGWLVQEFGLRSIFFAVAAGAAACAGGYSLLPELRTATPGEAKEETSFQELLRAPEQQALAGISVAFYAGTACKISLLPSVASEAFGAGPGEVGQLFSGLAALAIGGTLAGGRLTDAVGPKSVLLTCGSICTLAYVGAALATGAHAKDAFLGFLALWAVAAAVKSPALQAYAIATSPEDQRGAALSVPKTVGDLSYLIAPFLLGTLDDSFGPEAALLCCAGTFFAGTAWFALRS